MRGGLYVNGVCVKQIPLKNLRHTSLSLSIEAGVDILAVSRRTGHSNVGHHEPLLSEAVKID